MLKAVYLNDNENKDLIDFISNYASHSYKNITFNTESDLMKFLMILGYNSLINPSSEKENNNLITDLNNKLEELKSNVLTNLNYHLIESNNEVNKQLLNNNNQLITTLINLLTQFINNPYINTSNNQYITQAPIHIENQSQTQLTNSITPPQNSIITDINSEQGKNNIDITTNNNTNSFLTNLLANANR